MNALKVITLAAVAVCGSTQYYGYSGGLNHGLLHGHHGQHHGHSGYGYAPYAPILAKYHSQDELGQYSFGYTGGQSNRAETRDAYGNVRGSYSYIDSYGQPQTQHYVADALGFRVSGTNLPVGPASPNVLALAGPVPVQDTPEVAAAKADFQVAYDAAAAAAAAAPGDRKKRQAPVPVQDTYEVAHAKAEFYAAYNAAAAAAAAAPDYPNHHHTGISHHGYSGLHQGHTTGLHHDYTSGLHHGHAAGLYHGHTAGLHHGYTSGLHHGVSHLHHHQPRGFSYSHGYAQPTYVHVY